MSQDISINLPEDVDFLLSRLHSAGFEAYVVGGCVRDSILGREPNGWDIITSAHPNEVKETLSEFQTIDTAINYGTITAILNDSSHDITTYRTEYDFLDNRHPYEIFFIKKLEEDLKWRDFTINAMAYNKEDGLIDMFGGMDDLNKEMIRCVGDPRERFTEDALRMLRAVRFSAQLEFSVDPEVYKAICAMSHTLKDVGQDRITDEFVKILTSPHPEKLNTLYMSGLLDTFFPEFKDMMDTTQDNPYHRGTVGEHTIFALCEIPRDKILRLTMLFHDCGKPYCITVGEDGRNHFYGHPPVSAEKAKEIMDRMQFDNDTTTRVCDLVSIHDDRFEPVTEKAVKRAINRNGRENYPELFSIIRADMMGQSEYERDRKLAWLDEYEKTYSDIIEKENCFSINDLSVNGDDLIALGMTEGKEIGEILNGMLDAVLDNIELNKKELLISMFDDEIKNAIKEQTETVRRPDEIDKNETCL